MAEKAITEGRVTTAMNLFYKGKQKAAFKLAAPGKGLSPFPYALSLEQSKTEKLFVDYLLEKGKTILWKSEFVRFEQNDKGVKIYYKGPDGKEEIAEAGYLVGCDGAGSLVRQQMGLPFAGDTVPKIFYVTDVKLSSPVINKDELFIFLIKKGFVLFFPMEGVGHYRIVGILPDKTAVPDTFRFEDIENAVKKQIISAVEFQEVRWFSTYKVHTRKAGSFIDKRCFIAGDAAHIHTPAGGQGMNTGIQDAYNLAWKLAYTIKGTLNASVLMSYNTERMENAKHLLRTTDRMFDIMAGSNKFWDFIRLKIFPLIIRFVSKSPIFKRKVFKLISQTGIAYPNSSLTIRSSIGKVHSGDRMPYIIFIDGKNIFDHLTGPVFKLLYFGSDPANSFEQLKDLKFQTEIFSTSEIPISLFGNAVNFFILLRPDNHISYIGKDLNFCIIRLKKISCM